MHSKPVSRRRAALYTAAFSYAGLALTLLQGMLLAPLYLRRIDPALYGAWLASGNLVSYFGLFDLGIADALKQRVAYAFGSSDANRLGRTIWTGMTAIAVLALLPLLLGALCAGPVSALVGVSHGDREWFIRSLQVVTVAAALGIVSSGLQAVLAGLQRPVVGGASNIISTAIGIALTLLLLVRDWGLMALAAGVLARTVGILMLLLIGVAKVVREVIPGTRYALSYGELRATLQISSWSFASNVAYVAATQTDALIVATLLSPIDATRFVLTKRALDMVQMVCLRIPAAALPGLAHLAAENDGVALQRAARSVLVVNSAIAAVGIGGVAAFNSLFVGAWVGRDFFAGEHVSKLLTLAAFLGSTVAALNSTTYALGHIRKASQITMADAFVRVGLSLALGKALGLFGLALAPLLAFACVTFPGNLSSYGTALRVSPQDVLRTVLKAFLLGLVPAAVFVVGVSNIDAGGWAPLVLLATPYAVVAVVTQLVAFSELRTLAFRLKRTAG